MTPFSAGGMPPAPTAIVPAATPCGFPTPGTLSISARVAASRQGIGHPGGGPPTHAETVPGWIQPLVEQAMKIRFAVIFGLLAIPLLMGELPAWLLKRVRCLLSSPPPWCTDFPHFLRGCPPGRRARKSGVSAWWHWAAYAYSCQRSSFCPPCWWGWAHAIGHEQRQAARSARLDGTAQKPGDIVIRQSTPMEKVR